MGWLRPLHGLGGSVLDLARCFATALPQKIPELACFGSVDISEM